jgi:hypothetical protein
MFTPNASGRPPIVSESEAVQHGITDRFQKLPVHFQLFCVVLAIAVLELAISTARLIYLIAESALG